MQKNGAASCIDCQAQSPEADESVTLLSQMYGWRLVFAKDASGRRVGEWRCPTCWAQHRTKGRQPQQGH